MSKRLLCKKLIVGLTVVFKKQILSKLPAPQTNILFIYNYNEDCSKNNIQILPLLHYVQVCQFNYIHKKLSVHLMAGILSIQSHHLSIFLWQFWLSWAEFVFLFLDIISELIK